jgi:fatty-acyl-CoA synthase
MGNKPEWIIADFAICLLGGIMVAVNTWATGRELQAYLSHSDATMLIATDRYLKYDYFAMLDELEPLAGAMPLMKRIIHVGTRPYRDSLSFADVFARGRDVPDAAIDAAQDAIDPKDLAYILYTSGSTFDAEGRAAAALRADREHVAHRRAHARHAA